MKRIKILIVLAVFGMLIGSVYAAELHSHDFDGRFTLDVPSDKFSYMNAGECKYTDDDNNLVIEYFTLSKMHGKSFESYIDSLGLKEVGNEDNLTIYQDGSDYVIPIYSDEELIIITDDDLDEAKAIASSSDLKESVSSSSNDDSNNGTPFEEDTVVTIEGLNFTIPEGYAQVSGGSGNSDHVFAGENSTIIISVKNIGHTFTLNDVAMADGDEKKEINGTEGIVSTQSGSYGFTYGIDDYMISVFAPDETVVSTVISS